MASETKIDWTSIKTSYVPVHVPATAIMSRALEAHIRNELHRASQLEHMRMIEGSWDFAEERAFAPNLRRPVGWCSPSRYGAITIREGGEFAGIRVDGVDVIPLDDIEIDADAPIPVEEESVFSPRPEWVPVDEEIS